MDFQTAKLLTTVYELEGLLLVIDKHGADTPPQVVEALREKARKVGELAQLVELKPEDAAAEAQQPGEAAASQLPSDDYDAEETWQHDNGEEPAEVFGIGEDYVEPGHAAAPQPAKEPERLSEPEADNDPEEDDEEEAIENGEEEEEPEQDGEDVRVDEKLQCTLSKNLRQAFSINDRFRFRRELFSNSDLDMNDAINMVESMRTFDEAEDYFYSDLGWDKSVPEVQEFMDIIKRHFA